MNKSHFSLFIESMSQLFIYMFFKESYFISIYNLTFYSIFIYLIFINPILGFSELSIKHHLKSSSNFYSFLFVFFFGKGEKGIGMGMF